MQSQDMDTETAFTFKGVFQYVNTAFPAVILLENVAARVQKASASSTSDAEYTVERFMTLGYFVKFFEFDAECHGSLAAWTRVYFVG